jgi:hypothetical protein
MKLVSRNKESDGDSSPWRSPVVPVGLLSMEFGSNLTDLAKFDGAFTLALFYWDSRYFGLCDF